MQLVFGVYGWCRKCSRSSLGEAHSRARDKAPSRHYNLPAPNCTPLDVSLWTRPLTLAKSSSLNVEFLWPALIWVCQSLAMWCLVRLCLVWICSHWVYFNSPSLRSLATIIISTMQSSEPSDEILYIYLYTLDTVSSWISHR